jgi:WD40 repeat protein
MIVSLERNELAQITAIAFSQDGNQMAAVYESGRWGYMNAIKIWNTQTWNELLKISTAGYRLQQIAFSNSNMRLIVCTETDILSWNVEDGSPAQANTEDIACFGENLTKTLTNFGIDPNDVHGEALSPDHSLVAFIDADGFLETGNTVTQHRQASLFAFSSSYIREVSFSPNNQLIAAIEGRYDGTVDIHLWYLVPSRTSSTSITIPDSQWSSSIHLAFLSNDRLMIYDNRAGRVRIWDIEAEEFATDFSIEIDERSVLAVSPDLSVITSVSWQPDMPDVSLLHMQTWDIASGELLTDYLNPGSYERSPLLWKAVYSPNGEFIATAGRAAHLWNSQSGEEVGIFYDYTFLEGQWEIADVIFSPDGRFLVADTKEWNSLLYVWDVQRAVETHPATLQDPLADTGGLVAQLSHASATSVFNPNGELSISGAHGSFWGGDSTIQIWDTAHWEPITTLYGHIDGITSLVMASDGTLLASAGVDGTIRLWGIPIVQ